MHSLIQKAGGYFAGPARRKPRQERCNSASEADTYWFRPILSELSIEIVHLKLI